MTGRPTVPTAEPGESVLRRAADAGLRLTRARRAVVAALEACTGPTTAADLAERLADVPISSLYRSLAVLVDAGVVARVHETEGIARFELAEAVAGHHHHLVCRSCGTVIDVRPTPSADDTVAGIVEAEAARHGFTATGHHVDIEGVCAACRTP